MNTCSNCADGYDLVDVCTGKKDQQPSDGVMFEANKSYTIIKINLNQ